MSDYISREAVCEVCADVFGLPIDDGEEVIFEINRRVKRLPAADVRPAVHGHWEDRGSLSARCSECGCKSLRASDFCPNCGADMRGEQE